MGLDDEQAQDLATKEYEAGLANITLALIEAVNKIGIETTQESISYEPPWRAGRAIPDIIKFKIDPEGAPKVLLEFSQAQVEDCWDRIDREDVLGKIRGVMGEYERLRGAR